MIRATSAPAHPRPRWAIAGALLLSLLAGCASGFQAKLEATLTAVPGRMIKLDGTTTIPDGANINVTLTRLGDPKVILKALPLVKGGKFDAMLGPLDPGVKPGMMEVTLVFTPEAWAWSPEVIPAVGKQGEKMVGKQVKKLPNGIQVVEEKLSFGYDGK